MHIVHLNREQWVVAGVCAIVLLALAMLSWDALVFYRAADVAITIGSATARETKPLERDIDSVITLLNDRAAKFAALAPPSPSPATATTTPPHAVK